LLKERERERERGPLVPLGGKFGGAARRDPLYGGSEISRAIQNASRPSRSRRQKRTLYREQGEMKLSVSAYTAQASAHKNLCSYQQQRSYGATNQASTARTPSDLATVLPALKVRTACSFFSLFVIARERDRFY